MSPPKIKVRGAGRAKGVPSGYLLGRTSNGTGDVELLNLAGIRKMGVASINDLNQIQLAFIQLTDAPTTYAASALRVVRVNAAATGLEFHQEAFLDLADVPANYTAAALKAVRVNAAATALEFVTMNSITSTTLTVVGAGTSAVTINMPNSGVTAGSYTAANITVDAQGRVTAASNGFPGRETLTTNRTYFVRTDGNDANTGLANTAGGAFRHIQKAVDVAAALDCSTFNVSIMVADGTYAEAVSLRSMLGSGVFTIQGNLVTPANAIVSATSGDAFSAINIAATWNLTGFRVQTTTSGYGVRAQGFGAAIGFLTMEFGACATAHILALSAVVNANGNYSIVGAAPIHTQVLRHAAFSAFGATITITGTPAFGTSFAQCSDLGLAIFTACTFSGAATGVRFTVAANSVIETGGAGLTFLPGNAAGTSATGGQYI